MGTGGVDSDGGVIGPIEGSCGAITRWVETRDLVGSRSVVFVAIRTGKFVGSAIGGRILWSGVLRRGILLCDCSLKEKRN